MSASVIVSAMITKDNRTIGCVIVEWNSSVSRNFLLYHQELITQDNAYKSILAADAWQFTL
jgi:hypothetical protein